MLHAGVVQLARTLPCQGKGRRFESGHPLHRIYFDNNIKPTGRVAELVDALDLKSNELNTREGSSPSSPTILRLRRMPSEALAQEGTKGYFTNSGIYNPQAADGGPSHVGCFCYSIFI